ncbi:shikimate kinase [Candidatus Binatia bacterium]|nr:shikimate kinase [Candidatus Binatia bacterium]
MNVVLVGYRGTGKSSVAAVVARELGLTVVSLDAEIVRRAGKSIPEIVAEIGWPGFRDLEEEIVRTCAARDGQVIDCGGGVIEREANFAPLRAAGPVFWLRASTRTIVERIGGDTQRPSLTGTKSFTDEVEEVLARRRPLYGRIAHHVVDTDGRTVEEVAREVVEGVGG